MKKFPFSKSFGTVITERGIDLITLILVFIANFFIHLDKFELFKNTSIIKNITAKFDQLENPGIIYWVSGGIIFTYFDPIYITSGIKIHIPKFIKKSKRSSLDFMKELNP